MKKVSMILTAVLMVTGLASYAFADPGWSNGQRDDHRYQHERIYDRHDERDYRDYRDYRDDRDNRLSWRPYHRPVVVHSVPVAPPRPVVRIYEPPMPSVSLYFPNFSIQFR